MKLLANTELMASHFYRMPPPYLIQAVCAAVQKILSTHWTRAECLASTARACSVHAGREGRTIGAYWTVHEGKGMTSEVGKEDRTGWVKPGCKVDYIQMSDLGKVHGPLHEEVA